MNSKKEITKQSKITITLTLYKDKSITLLIDNCKLFPVSNNDLKIIFLNCIKSVQKKENEENKKILEDILKQDMPFPKTSRTTKLLNDLYEEIVKNNLNNN